jgi:Aspartyl/Asparaginyl beta-hydroxylase
MSDKIIEYLLKFRPSADWILKESGVPYLRLNINVPTDKILAEWDKVKSQAVLHRNDDVYGPLKNKGWHSLVLYGVDDSATAQTEGVFSWTDSSKLCTNTVSWLKETFQIDQNTRRIRFMLLEPGGFIVLHKDRDESALYEVNIAIDHPDECIFRFKNYGTVPFKSGQSYIMDISKEHFVVNRSDKPRLHIIAHAKIPNSIIEESYANCFYN